MREFADTQRALDRAREHARTFLRGLPERPVRQSATLEQLRADFGGPLPDAPSDPAAVVDALAQAADPGTIATSSGRFFGFVIGGGHPAALAADWLTAVWDQNAGLYVAGPAAAVAEEVCGQWLLELLGLPAESSFGFVTGGMMANFTALASARHHVLAAAGWDVEREGLAGAPPIRVVAGEQRHVTIDRALRYLGMGTAALQPVATDAQGAMDPAALRAVLAGGDGPTIVCAQAGDVNTGAIDPFELICDAAEAAGAWVHIDGAVGLWAAASPERRPLLRGLERADSWSTDAHKWLNVPYDCGIVFVAHPESHRGAMTTTASYLIQSAGPERDEMHYNPEFSRRARGFAVYATLRSLGRAGVVDLVERCCAHARRFAERLGPADGVEILNDVVLNQVLVRFPDRDPGGDGDQRTRAVVEEVQRDGICWVSGSTWRGQAVMRISVSNWSTTTDDVDRSVDAILRVAAQTRARPARAARP